MPVWLVALWPRLRPVLPWILAGLAIIAALWGLHHAGYIKGKHYADAHVQSLNDALAASNKSVADLKAAVATQNAAVDALKAQGDARAADAAKALSDAQRANTALSGKLADLDKAGSARPQAGCPSAPSVIAAKESL